VDGALKSDDERIFKRRPAVGAGNSGTRVDHILYVRLERQPRRLPRLRHFRQLPQIGSLKHCLVTAVRRTGTGVEDHAVAVLALSPNSSQI
jgi:hypothetical protein